MLEVHPESRFGDIPPNSDSLPPTMALETLGDCILVYDTDGTCHWTSAAGAALFGQSVFEMVGSRILDLQQQRFRNHIDAWQQALASRESSPFLAKLDVGGQSQWVGASFVPVLDGQGAPRWVVATVGLEAQMRRLSETAVSAQRRLIESDRLRALGELASGVAHDLNNYLAAALARTQLLMDMPTSEAQLNSLRLIERATHDAAQVVKRILDFGRGRPETQPASVDLVQLAGDVVELTRHKWSDEAQRDGRTIRVSCTGEDAPPSRGNYAELREVLTNVVINACEAIDGDGAIEIATGENSGRGFVSVSDTGPGMSSEVRDRVFEPFFTTKYSGTGLGLSIARDIVSRHGGSVEVESEEGKGSRVVVTLPLADPVDVPQMKPQPTQTPLSRDYKVLIIDDEAVIGSTLAEILSLVGHTVATAVDGEQGLSLFREGGYDLVMTDLGMPGLTGWDVVKEIRERGSDVPVIMITGWATAIDEDDLRQHRVDRVLTKPFEVDDVLRLVHELLAEGDGS